MPDTQWFALRTRHQHEQAVHARLAQSGFETLLPTSQRRSQWQDRIRTLTVPLFPGYCFARFELGRHVPILRTPGVITIVGSGAGPEALSKEDVDTLERLQRSRTVCTPCPELVEGDRVRITQGPLEGLVGVVIRQAQDDECHVVIRIRMIHQGARVQVPAAFVVPLSR